MLDNDRADFPSCSSTEIVPGVPNYAKFLIVPLVIYCAGIILFIMHEYRHNAALLVFIPVIPAVAAVCFLSCRYIRNHTRINHEIRACAEERIRHAERQNGELVALNDGLSVENVALKAANEDLGKSNSILAQSESMLSAFMANLPGMVYRCSGYERSIRYVSCGCLELTEYPLDRFGKAGIATVDSLVFAEDRERVKDEFIEKFGNNIPFEMRYRIVTRTGEVRWVWDRVRPITSDKDNWIAEGFISDISELEKKDQQLRQAQKMETIGTLAGGLAHDFNNILGGIVGSVSLLDMQLVDGAAPDYHEMRECLGIIRDASERAADMIKRLLMLSRKHEPHYNTADLNELCDNVIRICRSSLPKSVDIRFSPSDEKASVLVDPVQIEQVVLNLCINASHAMTIMRAPGERQGGILSVNVRRRKDAGLNETGQTALEDFWTVRVSDTGVGMDASTRARVFEPFFSMKPDRAGSGLGLSMAYAITEKHNGLLRLESEPGRGSVFELFLPSFESESPGIEVRDETGSVECYTGIILVVDDEDIMRNVLRRMLERSGYTVILAGNGEEGIALYRERMSEIDAVILDMSMPGLSGRETFRVLKDMNPDVSVVIVSGFRQEDDFQAMLREGAVSFMQKPFTAAELVDRLCGVLWEIGRKPALEES